MDGREVGPWGDRNSGAVHPGVGGGRVGAAPPPGVWPWPPNPDWPGTQSGDQRGPALKVRIVGGGSS